MRKRNHNPRSLGDLVASMYDEMSSVTKNTDLAARLTARSVSRWLLKVGRPDLVRRLAHEGR
jgi:hypothetical protein